MTGDRTVPKIRSFVEKGGTVVAIGDSAANLAAYLQLPIENHLVENGAPLPRAKFFVPGSVLSARVDTSQPIAKGMRTRTDVFFDNSPVFRLAEGAADAGVRSIARFDGPTPLRSGWAWGQKYLDGGVIAIEARSVGAGSCSTAPRSCSAPNRTVRSSCCSTRFIEAGVHAAIHSVSVARVFNPASALDSPALQPIHGRSRTEAPRLL